MPEAAGPHHGLRRKRTEIKCSLGSVRFLTYFPVSRPGSLSLDQGVMLSAPSPSSRADAKMAQA